MNRLFSIKAGLLAGLMLIISGSAQAFAHEFILKPVQKDEKQWIEIQAAHVFMLSDEMEPLQDVELSAVQKDVQAAPLTITENPDAKALQAERPATEAACLILGHRKPQLWSDTTEDVLAGDRKTLEAQGYKVLATGKYEKFAKLLLNADPADTALYNLVAGSPLEIVLLSNPAALKPGDKVRCQVLWQGKPLQTEVRASYDGFTSKEDIYAITVESNAEGLAEFTVDQPGIWFIQTANTQETENGADADKWIVRATYTFEVK